MDNPTSPDLLSELSLDVIHTILSLVPIRDAVRTSVLSRQWRYIWASLPDLVFDEKCVNPPMWNQTHFKRLDHFINQVLLLHKGPIHKFQLYIKTEVQSPYSDQWLPFLSGNDIRVLVLHARFCYHSLHTSLYSCQYLTRLELQIYRILPPPQSFKGFPCLKSLDLSIFKVSSTTIQSFVAHSPLLEELTLYGDRGWELKICAPNLKYLYFRTWEKSELSLCTPLLEELKANFECDTSYIIGLSSVFPHLRIAKLLYVPFDDNEVTPAVVQLITSSPNLQKLEISGYSVWSDASELGCASLRDAESAPDISYDNLKVIKMVSFCGVLNEMILIRFLLARTPVLEKMMYTPHSSVPEEELQNLIAELLSFRRASANAQILIGEY